MRCTQNLAWNHIRLKVCENQFLELEHFRFWNFSTNHVCCDLEGDSHPQDCGCHNSLVKGQWETKKQPSNDDHWCHPPDTTLSTPYDRNRIIDTNVHSSFLPCPAMHLGTRDQWPYQSRCQGNKCRKGEWCTSGSLSCSQEGTITSFQLGTKVLPLCVPQRERARMHRRC